MHPEGYNLGMYLRTVSGAGIAEYLRRRVVPPDSLENTCRKLRQAWE